MIESYLATYDYNLPLRDAERDPELSLRRRMLAAIGCHVALDSGYYDAQSLAAGLLDIASERNEGLDDGKGGAAERLQDLLGRGSEARMNRPGKASGNWAWRFTEEALSATVAARLAELTTTYGRRRGPTVAMAEAHERSEGT